MAKEGRRFLVVTAFAWMAALVLGSVIEMHWDGWWAHTGAGFIRGIPLGLLVLGYLAYAEMHPLSRRRKDMSKKLEIEVSEATDADLDDLAELDKAAGLKKLNKTTQINRAVQLWAVIRRHQHAGGKVYFQDKGSDELQPVTFE